MRFKSILPYAAVVVMLAAPLARAEDDTSLPTAAPDSGERINRQVMASGGAVNLSSANYHMSATAGQTSVGRAASANYRGNFGFWQTLHAPGCCNGRVGDANGIGGDEPTIGDVSSMIDAKFISGSCTGVIACLSEADINQTGGANPTCDDITIGDISILIDYLFITGPTLGLHNCL